MLFELPGLKIDKSFVGMRPKALLTYICIKKMTPFKAV